MKANIPTRAILCAAGLGMLACPCRAEDETFLSRYPKAGTAEIDCFSKEARAFRPMAKDQLERVREILVKAKVFDPGKDAPAGAHLGRPAMLASIQLTGPGMEAVRFDMNADGSITRGAEEYMPATDDERTRLAHEFGFDLRLPEASRDALPPERKSP